MLPDDITIISKQLIQISSSEVEEVESSLGITFPEAYRDFITRFGEGAMTDIRIYPPRRIMNGLNKLKQWRKRIAAYWFWNHEPVILKKEKALECVIIGDTFDGDELTFHPNEPDTTYFLPRHKDNIFKVEGGLYAAMQWYCTSGVLIHPYSERTFEAFDSRSTEVNTKIDRL